MNDGRIVSQAGLDAKIKRVCDVLRRSNCAGALQYVPELSWLLFLRFLDEREERERSEAAVLGIPFAPTLDAPYRWRDWAAPTGSKRRELQDGSRGAVFRFLEKELLPHLHRLGATDDGSPRCRLVSQVVSGTQGTRVDTERNFLDVLDRVDEIRLEAMDDQHLFPLSAAYEGLLLDMGQKNNDGGQFFTPREVARAMVRVVAPRAGETVFDPCCGTGGFLAQAREYMLEQLGDAATGPLRERLARQTFWGLEKDNIVYPIALANLVLHGIDRPGVAHGNTLTGTVEYGGLFAGAPATFDVILTNPPFGGSEGEDAKTRFAFKTSSTQVLFLQDVIDKLADGGRAGFVVDEGLLFRTNERAFVQTKRKLLDECDLWCVVSLAPGVFTTAGSGVKTNLLFFRKGAPTERTWYYELAPHGRERFTKTAPLTLEDFREFFELLPERDDSERSWTVERAEFERNGFDLKAVNPNRLEADDERTAMDVLKEVEEHRGELDAALSDLRATLEQ